ncbi:MAG TPA: L-threonylcarbamoyladenylate synthase [Candidatus Bathyarchaeia archaeon]|nr:L-threonylcarbamoyladenylate synthase [Candidatus Bathyarchaeia archaeon]
MGHLYWNDKEANELIFQALTRSELILGTSDTVWGIMADISRAGYEALNTLKRRPPEKPYLILSGNVEKAKTFFEGRGLDNERLDQLMHMCWPGPVTLVGKACKELPAYLRSREGTIAVRVPQHAGLQAILTRSQGLFSTSANIAGCPVPSTFDEIDEKIRTVVRYIVVEKSTILSQVYPSVPSTILDCSRERIKVVRRGAFAIERLETLYGDSFD